MVVSILSVAMSVAMHSQALSPVRPIYAFNSRYRVCSLLQRTARQDRPGQYYVYLSAEEDPFANEPALAPSLRGRPPDAIIEELLKRKDESTAQALTTHH